MIKVATLTFDIYDDRHGVIAKTLPPEFHGLNVGAAERLDSLSDNQFGLVMKTASGVRRRYPLDNADAVKLSSAYFERVRDTLHPALVEAVEEKLKNPGSTKVAYVDVTKLEPAAVKTASPSLVYGLTIDGRDCFPLHNSALVKTAIAAYPNTAIELSPVERFLYARNINKQASALNVSIPDNSPINLYTAEYPNKDALRIAIQQRKEACGHQTSTEVLDRLYADSGCDPIRGPMENEDSFADRMKIAKAVKPMDAGDVITILDTFDKLAGFTSEHYLRGMLDPFAAMYKKADCEPSAASVDGVDLSKISADRLSEHFDAEFIGEFQQNPIQVYMASPEPVKSLLRDMAKSGAVESGVGVGEGDPTDQLGPQLSNPLRG